MFFAEIPHHSNDAPTHQKIMIDMSSNINEWMLSEIIARREHLAMCKRWESSTANIEESTEKALNAVEATNECHNVEVFKKALKLYRDIW